MPQFPLISEYKQAIITADESFKDLLPLEMVAESPGQPKFASGNFAVVFKMRNPSTGKLYAVKCFHRDSLQRHERLTKIDTYINAHPSAYFVSYRYLPHELWVDSIGAGAAEYPVVFMEWAEGVTLYEAVKDYCSKGAGGQLRKLCDEFVQMALWLLQQPFSHGDLKHDNILVTPNGKLILVDYDGMYLPELQKFGPAEVGGDSYQHPCRNNSDYHVDIDDFSIAVIAVSLCALSLKPSLFNYKNDSLLFTKKDFINFDKSKLVKSLYALNDTYITNMLNEIKEALAKPSLKFNNLSVKLIRPILNPVAVSMVLIKSGTFSMGTLDINAAKLETVGYFMIGAYPVTFEEFDLFCEDKNYPKPRDFGWGRLKRPVVDVSWYDAIHYCNWLSFVNGYPEAYKIQPKSLHNKVKLNSGSKGYRLPTEKEWEFAARERGQNLAFGNGFQFIDTSNANFDANVYGQPFKTALWQEKTLPAGSFKPNNLGLYDMSGNVWEWCWDGFKVVKYANTDSQLTKVIRGGAWTSSFDFCTTIARQEECPDCRFNNIGFRVVRSL